MSDTKAMEKKKNKLTLFRRATQTVMLVILGQWSFYGIFRCPFPVPYVGCLNCPVIACQGRILLLFWGAWLLLPISALFFGRVFCAWFCPGGFINQLIGKVSFLKGKAKNIVSAIAPWGKYVGLIFVLYLWLVLDNPRWMVPVRVGEFWNSIILSFQHAGKLWLIRTFFVILFVVAGLLLANAWCRYACPFGGLLELLKRFSLFKMFIKNPSSCKTCNLCLQTCEMVTRPDEINCTNCGDCIETCPDHSIVFGRKR